MSRAMQKFIILVIVGLVILLFVKNKRAGNAPQRVQPASQYTR